MQKADRRASPSLPPPPRAHAYRPRLSPPLTQRRVLVAEWNATLCACDDCSRARVSEMLTVRLYRTRVSRSKRLFCKRVVMRQEATETTRLESRNDRQNQKICEPRVPCTQAKGCNAAFKYRQQEVSDVERSVKRESKRPQTSRKQKIALHRAAFIRISACVLAFEQRHSADCFDSRKSASAASSRTPEFQS